MKSLLALSPYLAAAGLAALLALGPGLRAADQPTAKDASQLVVLNGKIMPDGPVATLGNVIEIIGRRYAGKTSIILAGTADMRVGNIVLRLSEQNVDAAELGDVLGALREASGQAFALAFNAKTGIYTLTRPAIVRQESLVRHVAVFNLLPQRDPVFASVESELADAQTKLAALVSAGYLEQHPNMVSARARVEQLHKQQTEMTARQADAAEARMQEIQATVTEALHDLNLNDTPTFRFHQSSSLLIVTGTDAALDVAGKIVTAMGGTAGTSGGSGLFANSENSPHTRASFTLDPTSGVVPWTFTETPYPPPPNNSQSGSITPKEGVVISIVSDGTLRWENEPITQTELGLKLQAYKQAALPNYASIAIISTEGASSTTATIRSIEAEAVKAGVIVKRVAVSAPVDSPPNFPAPAP